MGCISDTDILDFNSLVILRPRFRLLQHSSPVYKSLGLKGKCTSMRSRWNFMERLWWLHTCTYSLIAHCSSTGSCLHRCTGMHILHLLCLLTMMSSYA